MTHSAFVNFITRESCEFADVEFFIERFRLRFSSEDLNSLQEFISYQLFNEDDIPKLVWDDACVVEKDDDGDEVKKYYRMDVIWGYLSTMKAADGDFCLRDCLK